jgi:multidrug efflux pump subunit AcrA (membrane-fusion protein)
MRRIPWKLIFLILALLAPAVVFIACSKNSQAASQTEKQKTQKYQCPMHPNYTSDKPGDCPVCGMNLVPMEDTGQTSVQTPQAAQPQTPRKRRMYRSTMNPNEVSDKPGKDSMGMEMEPFDVEEETAAPQVEGFSTVKISPEKQQLIGITTAAVKRNGVTRVVRTTGRVAYDPDLYYAEQEYLTALDTFNKAKTTGTGDFTESSQSLVEAARYRLHILGLGDEQIEALAQQGKPDKTLLTPEPGKGAWIYASIYEDDVRLVKPGQAALVSLPTVIREKFRGKVVAVDPVLDPQTRSARARIFIENNPAALKPDSYGSVEIQVPLGAQLTVPADAVMDTGTRQVVFIDKGQGVLEPREVKGYRNDGSFILQSGATAGEKVVTNANFLVDSESQLKAATKQAGGGHKH